MKLFKIVLSVAMAAVLFASCTSFKAAGFSYGVQNAPKYKVVGELKLDLEAIKFLGGAAGTTLFNISSEITVDIIRNAIERAVKDKGGDAAVNVTIEYMADFGNILVNSITGSIVAPSHILITGSIVKYE